MIRDNVLMLKYSTGMGTGGKLTLNLNEFFPAAIADCRRLHEVLSMGIENDFCSVCDYLETRIADLQKTREEADDKTKYGQKTIEKLNAEIKKLIACYAVFAPMAGRNELIDTGYHGAGTGRKVKTEKTIFFVFEKHGMKPYARMVTGHKAEIENLTFSLERVKGGYQVYYFGLNAFFVKSLNAIGTSKELEKILDTLKKNGKKYIPCYWKNEFIQGMKNAGFNPDMIEFPEEETETAEIKTEERTERKTEMKREERKMFYYADHVIFDGVKVPVKYSVTPKKTVVVFLESGRKFRLTADKEGYAEALNAAKQAAEQTAAEQTAAEQTAADPEEQTAAETAEQAEQAAEQAAAEQKRPVPEKTFAGTEIVGKGWKIVFNAQVERTQIKFTEDPIPEAKKILEKEKFFYSSVMKTWNKKLTWKAYRAALRTAEQLKKIYA